MKKAFVDYDSMLYDLQEAAIKRAKEVYNVELTYEDIDCWTFFERYPEAIKAYTEWEHYSKGIHFDGAVEFMHNLYDIFGKDNVFILTNSHSSLIEKKDKEIEKIYGTKNIIHAEHKYLITGDNFLFDDYHVNIEKHVQHNKNGIGVLFDYQGRYSWNKKPIEKEYNRVIRATDYNEIIEFVKLLKS